MIPVATTSAFSSSKELQLVWKVARLSASTATIQWARVSSSTTGLTLAQAPDQLACSSGQETATVSLLIII